MANSYTQALNDLAATFGAVPDNVNAVTHKCVGGSTGWSDHHADEIAEYLYQKTYERTRPLYDTVNNMSHLGAAADRAVEILEKVSRL